MKRLKVIGIIIFGVALLAAILCYLNRPERVISLAVKKLDFSNSQSSYVVLVSKITNLGEGAIPVLVRLIKSESTIERWTAIVSLSNILKEKEDLTDTIIPIFKQSIDDKDDNLRMLIGAELISWGEIEGIPILISCLNSEEAIYFSQPQELVKEGARGYLMEYTDYDGINFQKWQNWWGNNQGLILWSESEKSFELKKEDRFFRQ